MNDTLFNVTLGRRVGSGGLDIARSLGAKLGVDVYDKELLNVAAKEFGIGAEFFANADEKNPYVLGDSALSSGALFDMQSRVIRKLAGMKSNIFVGRCADYVLRDTPNLIRIFITAPLDFRIGVIAAKHGVSPQKAEEYIRKKEKMRQSYYEFFSFKKWASMESYDFCFDSSILGFEKTAESLSFLVQEVIK
jgi:cytidylate kinase